jgi:hypothetical protein
MIIRYKYEAYKESKLATALSAYGGGLKTLGLLCTIAAILTCFSDDKTKIIRTLIMGIGMLVAGFVLDGLAKRTVDSVIIKRLLLSTGEVEELVRKKPELKIWFLEYHRAYKDEHVEEIEFEKMKVLDAKRESKGKEDRDVVFALIIIMVGCIGYIIVKYQF